MKPIYLLALFQFIFACGREDAAKEDYGDLFIDQKLMLTESGHEHGWGYSRCFLCHTRKNIHRNERHAEIVDYFALRLTVLEEGIESCKSCHGGNGVEE